MNFSNSNIMIFKDSSFLTRGLSKDLPMELLIYIDGKIVQSPSQKAFEKEKWTSKIIQNKLETLELLLIKLSLN